jgi:dethiobiotin synthetase
LSARTRGFFVTGTDTGVGKTEVACALIRAAARRDIAVVGMKPVAAGARRVARALVNTDVVALRNAGSMRVGRSTCNPYLFAPAIAPHLAAKEVDVQLDLGVILRAFRALSARAELVIVEGAGGFRVPLDDRRDMSDLARRMRLPVVLVVGMRLGCISHALLTAEAIAARGLMLAGWVANRIDPSMARYRDNVVALRARIAAPLLADVPFVSARRSRAAVFERSLDTHVLSELLPGASTSRT